MQSTRARSNNTSGASVFAICLLTLNYASRMLPPSRSPALLLYPHDRSHDCLLFGGSLSTCGFSSLRFFFFLYLILDFFASLCALAPSSICLVACHGTRTPHRLPGRAASILLCFACKYTCNLSFNAVSTHPPLPRPIRRPSSHIP